MLTYEFGNIHDFIFDRLCAVDGELQLDLLLLLSLPPERLLFRGYRLLWDGLFGPNLEIKIAQVRFMNMILEL
jgi:hypothetical protein